MHLENVDVHFLMLYEESKEYALSCFQSRQRANKEPWIIYLKDKALATALSMMQMGKLDLDDEVILALHNGNEVEIWEVYKISPEYNLEYNKLGMWSEKNGLDLTTVQKWYRRGDLKVHISIFFVR